MEETKDLGGRPTKLTEELVQRAKDYFYSCVDKPMQDGNGKTIGWEVNIPTKEGLALHLDVSRATLYNWADPVYMTEGATEAEIEIKRRFLDIFEKIMAEQGRRLINKGLSGHYNPLMSKLLLGKHGYKDMSDMTSGDEPIRGIEVEVMDRRKDKGEAAQEAAAATATANETKTAGDPGVPAQPVRTAKSK